MNRRRIYLDHAASTPVHAEVVAAMLPYWTEVYGNPSSSHEHGRFAHRALEQARERIAAQFNAHPDEIVFTGGGSASDNLALRGVMLRARHDGGGNHLIISAIEHSAVMRTAVQLRDYFGFDLTILPVDRFGQIDVEALKTAVTPQTVLISIMAANNEIGSLQPIEAIGSIARENGVLFHSDAVQAIAARRWDMETMPIDLMSVAPHKFYGPKGIGVLFARRGAAMMPILTGGGQENGRWAGTSNVAFGVGTAVALEMAMDELEARNAHYLPLRDHLIDKLLSALPDRCVLTGHPSQRLPHNASFAFRHVRGNDLLMHLDMAGISGSSGSACKTGDPKPSRILQAIGLGDEWTKGGLRLTVGRQTTMDDVLYAAEKIPEIIGKIVNG